MINAITTALTGLAAASQKVTASANNIANVTTGGSLEDGEKAPYTPQTVQQETLKGGGVKTNIAAKNPPFTPSYSPDSPLADSNGIIGLPNVDLAEEGVNLMLSEVEYKANLKVIETAAELSDELIKSLDKKA
ncbi:MAG: flagellar biosynthesis protein FlgC [Micavibrio sp.]|nr:flagellar biosynthesis protein FlgC [Micavibrio sp.]